MDAPLSLTLPKPPSKNNQHRTRVIRSKKSGQQMPMYYPTEEYKRWKAACREIIDQLSLTTITDECCVTIIASKPDNRKRDVFNYVDPVMDMLQECKVIEDDSQCSIGFCGWHRDEDGNAVIDKAGGVEITIETSMRFLRSSA